MMKNSYLDCMFNVILSLLKNTVSRKGDWQDMMLEKEWQLFKLNLKKTMKENIEYDLNKWLLLSLAINVFIKPLKY